MVKSNVSAMTEQGETMKSAAMGFWWRCLLVATCVGILVQAIRIAQLEKRVDDLMADSEKQHQEDVDRNRALEETQDYLNMRLMEQDADLASFIEKIGPKVARMAEFEKRATAALRWLRADHETLDMARILLLSDSHRIDLLERWIGYTHLGDDSEDDSSPNQRTCPAPIDADTLSRTR